MGLGDVLLDERDEIVLGLRSELDAAALACRGYRNSVGKRSAGTTVVCAREAARSGGGCLHEIAGVRSCHLHGAGTSSRAKMREGGSEMSQGAILVVGGYGLVGSRIASDLAEDYADGVVIAGRSVARAKETAAGLGRGVRGRRIDVADPSSFTDALDGIAVVVSCIDQPDRALLHAAIERGLGYTDITPHLTELGRGAAYEAIDAAARASGARVVLGAGLVPGISSVMVRAVAEMLDGADSIDTSLLLSANDRTGPASSEYFLQELTMPFAVHLAGRDQPAHAFSDPRDVTFPPPIGPRRAYLFPFSDQVLYPRTMGADTVTTRLALDPPRLAHLLAFLIRTRAIDLPAIEPVLRKVSSRRRERAPNEGAQFALRVDVRHGEAAGYARLVGRGQASAAATGAAGVVRSLLNGEVIEAGAWMPEQVVDPRKFFGHLARRGLNVDISTAQISSASARRA